MDESHRVTATCVLPSGSVSGGRAGAVNTPASERRTWRLRRAGRAVPGRVGSAAFRVSDLGRWARFKNRRFLRRSAPCVRRSQHRVDTQRDESSRTEHTCAPSTRVERAPPAPSRRPPRVPLRPQRPPLLAALPPPAFQGRRPPRPLLTREERRVRRARLLCHVGFAIPACPRVSSRVLAGGSFSAPRAPGQERVTDRLSAAPGSGPSRRCHSEYSSPRVVSKKEINTTRYTVCPAQGAPAQIQPRRRAGWRGQRPLCGRRRPGLVPVTTDAPRLPSFVVATLAGRCA